MTPKFPRLLLVAAVAAGFGILPMPGARADSAVVVADMPTGFSQQPGVAGQCKSIGDANQMPQALRTDIHPGDTVTFYVSQDNQKAHNVVPATDMGSGKWPVGKSADLHAGDDPYPVTFKDPGVYWYYSNIDGEGSETKGKLSGMCGVIRVGDTTTTTTPPDTAPPTTQPPTTPTTAPADTTATTAPASAGPAATHPATPAAPAPTTTAPPKPEKDKKPKEDTSSSSTTAPPVNGPTDLPAEAIVPSLPSGATVTQDGAVQPSGTPTGDAIAVIKHKHGHGPVILLVVSGLGIGGLGVGVGIYKWANRSSQYFPA